MINGFDVQRLISYPTEKKLSCFIRKETIVLSTSKKPLISHSVFAENVWDELVVKMKLFMNYVSISKKCKLSYET